jgi:uncharacterized membrane-anchored protein
MDWNKTRESMGRRYEVVNKIPKIKLILWVLKFMACEMLLTVSQILVKN